MRRWLLSLAGRNQHYGIMKNLVPCEVVSACSIPFSPVVACVLWHKPVGLSALDDALMKRRRRSVSVHSRHRFPNMQAGHAQFIDVQLTDSCTIDEKTANPNYANCKSAYCQCSQRQRSDGLSADGECSNANRAKFYRSKIFTVMAESNQRIPRRSREDKNVPEARETARANRSGNRDA